MDRRAVHRVWYLDRKKGERSELPGYLCSKREFPSGSRIEYNPTAPARPCESWAYKMSNEEGSPVADSKCRVLCVDDHHDTSEMLELLLSKEDYEVETAGTMEDACRLAETKQFDLYVLDRRLPDASGLELCERLQEISPGVPCIFYSGDAYELHRREAIAAGAAAYVAKPDIDGLIDAVQKLLAESNCAATSK